jgi:hypothetical protein
MIRSRILAGIVGGLSLIAFSAASADIIPTHDSTTPEGDNFRWHYSAMVSESQRVESGDFFTIYDFVGFVPGTNQQPEGWVFSAQNVGVTPDRVFPDDNAGIVNLTWSWAGAGNIGTGAEDVDLGMFSAISELGQLQLGWFTGRGTNSTGGLEDGTEVANVGRVATPIPLPAAALMFPLGAVVAGLAYRRMKV